MSTETFGKNNWENSLRTPIYLLALRLLLELCEDICILFSLTKPLQLKSPKKETKKGIFVNYLPTRFVCLHEMKVGREGEGK